MSSTARSHLAALILVGVLLAGALVAFNLLYLSTPAGLTPVHGHLPEVGPAYTRAGWPIPRLTLGPTMFRTVALLLMAVTWLCWLLAVRLTATLTSSGRSAPAVKVVAIIGALCSLALILTPPVLSGDLYHHALIGRMVGDLGLNPYFTSGDALRGDPLWHLASWRSVAAHYGPVSTWLSTLAMLVGGGGVVAAAVAFKTIAALSVGACAWAIHALVKAEGRDGLPPATLIAWSPLVLLETAGSGHNDSIMMAFALLGLLLARRGRLTAGFLLLVLSIHVKWVTAILALLLAMTALRRIETTRARLRQAALILGAAILSTLALYAPFWEGPRTLAAITHMLSLGRSAADPSGPGPAVVGPLLFLAVTLLALVVAWRQGSARVLDMSAAVSIAFVLFVFPFKFPWYFIPALTLLAPAPRTPLNRVLLILCLICAGILMIRWAALVPLDG